MVLPTLLTLMWGHVGSPCPAFTFLSMLKVRVSVRRCRRLLEMTGHFMVVIYIGPGDAEQVVASRQSIIKVAPTRPNLA